MVIPPFRYHLALMRVEGITIKPYYQQLIHGAAKDACWKKKKLNPNRKTPVQKTPPAKTRTIGSPRWTLGSKWGNFSAKSLKSLDCQDKSGPATLFHQQTAGDMTKGMRPRGMKMWFLNGPLLVLAKPRLLNPCFELPFYVLSNNPAYIHSKNGYTDIPFIHRYCIYVEK